MKWIMSILASLGIANAQIFSDGLSIPISQKSIDLIIKYEVSSKSYYEKYLAKPTVPAWQTTQSGVTIGIGADLGYLSHSQIESAFKGVVSDSELSAMKSVSGMKGKNAYYNGLPKVKNVVYITYAEAETVFKRYTLPSFSRQTSTAFNLKKDTLHPHSNGSLISLVYNRGASMSGDSRREMRMIRDNIASGKVANVPANIRSMKRLWSYSKLKGLHLRRDEEAALFQLGIDESKR